MDREVLVFEDAELGIFLPSDVLTLVSVVLGFLLEYLMDGGVFGHDRALVIDVLVGEIDVLLPEKRVFFLEGRDAIGVLPTQTKVLLIGIQHQLLQFLVLLQDILAFDLTVLPRVGQKRLMVLDLSLQLGHLVPVELLHFLQLVLELQILLAKGIQLFVGKIYRFEHCSAWAVGSASDSTLFPMDYLLFDIWPDILSEDYILFHRLSNRNQLLELFPIFLLLDPKKGIFPLELQISGSFLIKQKLGLLYDSFGLIALLSLPFEIPFQLMLLFLRESNLLESFEEFGSLLVEIKDSLAVVREQALVVGLFIEGEIEEVHITRIFHSKQFERLLGLLWFKFNENVELHNLNFKLSKIPKVKHKIH